MAQKVVRWIASKLVIVACLSCALFPSAVYADHAAPTIPVFDFQSFHVGQSWIWDYFAVETRAADSGLKLFSTEQYQIIAIEGEAVWLEMSTQFPGQSGFSIHNRMKILPRDCLNSYVGATIKLWSFDMFYLENGVWAQYTPPTTLAFEEKFNCNAGFYGDSDPITGRSTLFRDSGSVRLFQQKSSPLDNSTWFFASGPNHGLAAEKHFVYPNSTSFIMRLRSVSHCRN